MKVLRIDVHENLDGSTFSLNLRHPRTDVRCVFVGGMRAPYDRLALESIVCILLTNKDAKDVWTSFDEIELFTYGRDGATSDKIVMTLPKG